MQLRIKPYHKSVHPFFGVLIKSSSIHDWIIEMQKMELPINSICVFQLPYNTPNSIWGCLVTYNESKKIDKIGKNVYCQLIKNKLFIPENSILFPALSDVDIDKLFPTNKYIFHPEFGLFELSDPLNWSNLLVLPVSSPIKVKQPFEGAYIPTMIYSFQVKAISTEDILDNLEKNLFPKREKLENKPLSMIEKIRLQVLRTFIGKKKGNETTGKTINKEKPILKAFESIGNYITQTKWANKLMMDLDELERRNQKEVDKLLDLFIKNPEMALQYAIPLDEIGSSRGGNLGRLDLTKKWFDFSLFRNITNGSGSGIISSGHYNQLHNQYQITANELVKNKEYHKAAFIYMKLLKNYYMAAQTLEKGEIYQEAASIYLKYANNKNKAAECFEKGNMISQAIEVYEELKQDEKVGDLYLSINQKDKANYYYHKVINNYQSRFQFVKASLIYKYKIKDTSKAQALLMEGWRMNKDAYNCLNNYFSGITDAKQLENEIDSIYAKETNKENKEIFLQVLKHEFDRFAALEQLTRDIAHEIISEVAQENPTIISELRSFNKKDNMLVKDIMKFKKK